jgi:hypothetical protein
MPFSLHGQYLDAALGFHVIELRSEHGHSHLVQIAVGQDACPACGAVHPKDNLGELDPKALVAEVTEQLNASHAAMLEYAAKHRLPVK